ncbi:MAG: VCBS repeat-containing protein, partial [Longimicrobiales bacterium]
CDGTFTEALAEAMGHTSESSMGVDAADFNNDVRPDIIVLDMLPEREDILKTSETAVPFEVERLTRQMGYHPQYARNTLQLNRGRGRFSEIAYLSGVHATDWSWASLFADLDNDGHKDLFITNGIVHRPNDLDYLVLVRQDSVQAVLENGLTEEELSLLVKMPHVPIANYAYRNNGDLTFTNEADAWGLAEPGFSSGAAYVDLDNDGALDLVVNNINAPASVYRNRARGGNGHHYLKVDLRGAGRNTGGIGAKVVIAHDGVTQMLEQMPTRGFQSSVDPRLHFGLGTSELVDSLVVIWPDHRYQVLTDITADRTLTLDQGDATGRYAYARPSAQALFTDTTTAMAVEFEHEENPFFDDSREPLIPHRLSTEGPALAVGDVNGDNLDDIYVGGAKRQAGRLLIQQSAGGFDAAGDSVLEADRLHEDVDAAFFDADGDGDLDLYVVSAGNEFWGDHDALRDRLYINDGRGGLRRDPDRLPDFFTNGACVAAADYDGDGDVDLFVGGRVVARGYGLAPRSYLLANDGSGRFTDVTSEIAAPLAEVGMVTSATWLDYDRDGGLDLVVVGEWMPVTVFRQEGGRFVDRTAEAGFSATNGWWNVVVSAELTGDGHDDLVLGNLGLNSYIKASREEPAELYVHDFSRDGALDPILTFYKGGISYPLAGRDELVRQLPNLRRRYKTYADYGASRIEDIFPASELERANVLRAYDFASAVAVNNGDGTFTPQRLPAEAQFAPVHAIMAEDFDGDGHADLLLAGNFFGVPPVRGRYDASWGLLLRGDGTGRFEAVDIEESGVLIEGEVRAMQPLRGPAGDRLIVVARNNEALRFLRPRAGTP